MKASPCLGALLAVALLQASFARADGPWVLFDGCRWAFPRLRDEWRHRRCWCPDDYHCKTLPAVPPNPRGCGNDYCPKALPCVPPNARGCVDDYCPKTCPLFLGKLCEPWYSCGRSQDGGAGACPNSLSKQ